jgi:hypothetical protein
MSREIPVEDVPADVDAGHNRCPLCRTMAMLEFHHWSYDPEIGICLCRRCHDDIHSGRRMSHQQNLAESLGQDSWLKMALDTLVLRELAFLPPEVFDIRGHTWDEFRQRLRERYNVPDAAPEIEKSTAWTQVKHTGQPAQGTPMQWEKTAAGNYREELDRWLDVDE